MEKATHSGHCQACGSLQKLPGGVLSLHGYKVTSGFFSGICRGARELPFELSCELVKGFIVSAKAELAAVNKRIAKLNAPATTATTMIHVWVKHDDAYRRSGYEWRQVEVKSYVNERGYTYFFHGDEYQINKNELNGAGHAAKDVLDVATYYNRVFAKWLGHEVVSLRRYIAWQTERVANWKPAELLPVDVKDNKAGFKPEQPAY